MQKHTCHCRSTNAGKQVRQNLVEVGQLIRCPLHARSSPSGDRYQHQPSFRFDCFKLATEVTARSPRSSVGRRRQP
eukprot:2869191-Pyramimonas_sp.AAC.1